MSQIKFLSHLCVCLFICLLWVGCSADSDDPPSFGPTKLQKAIVEGLKPENDLSELLADDDVSPPRTEGDGYAICYALDVLPERDLNDPKVVKDLSRIVDQFQNYDYYEEPGFAILMTVGFEKLRAIFDANFATIDESTNPELSAELLDILTVFATWQDEDGCARIVKAARKPLLGQSYSWHFVLSPFDSTHTEYDQVFTALSNPLPCDPIAKVMLNIANQGFLLETFEVHPFDSDEGVQRLRTFIASATEGDFSDAAAATLALAYIKNSGREEALKDAMNSPVDSLRLEAAWAAAKSEMDSGFEQLAKLCLALDSSAAAKEYLEELDRVDLIPEAALEPEFSAKAEISRWLADQSWLSMTPDFIEVVDYRNLHWPPDGKDIPLWILKLTVKDRTGLGEDGVYVGVVGSVTRCLFNCGMSQRSPEDIYAIHCASEMQDRDLLLVDDGLGYGDYSGGDYEDSASEDYEEPFPEIPLSERLNEWWGKPITNPVLVYEIGVSEELNYPSKLVAVVAGEMDGDEGWLILDGKRSHWYPKSEQPTVFDAGFEDESRSSVVWELHLGRQLLNFGHNEDRLKHLGTPPPKRSPQEIVTRYEQLIEEARTAEPKRHAELLLAGPLETYFNKYVDALEKVKGESRDELLVKAYEDMIALTDVSDSEIRQSVQSWYGLFGDSFPAYVDACVAMGDKQKVVKLIERFSANWNDDYGNPFLARAAMKVERSDLAERFILRMCEEGVVDTFKEISLLAEVRHENGETQKARDLLENAMRELSKNFDNAEYPYEREAAESVFQVHRATYLKLFLDAEQRLTKLKIPESLK